MVYHDSSTIADHTHFLVMVSAMYDHAVYHTNEEYQNLYNVNIDAQAIVAKPRLDLLARCLSNDQQLAYSEEQLHDIVSMTTEKTEIDNIVNEDVLQVFKGDNTAAELESRHQKGENYFCSSCPLNLFYSKSVFYTRNLP